MSILRHLKSLPFQLILCLVLGFAFGNYLPLSIANSIYTISCFIKDMLMIILPFVIFSFIWAAIVSFGNRGALLITAMFVLIIAANFVAIFTAYIAGTAVLPHIIEGSLPHLNSNSPDAIKSLWSLSNSLNLSFMEPKYGMIGGALFGFITLILSTKSLGTADFAKQLTLTSVRMRNSATTALKVGFIPFLPLYVLGFVIKLARDGHLYSLIQGCAHTFLFICGLILAYLFFWYSAGCGFNMPKTFKAIKNMLPAGLTGFTTMSSSATMPVTLAGIEKNLKDPDFANFFTPATANPHMAGDGLSIIIIAMALLLMSGHELPSLSVFWVYALHYCLVKFSAAGVPGGGVIVILPVVQDCLGLDATLVPLLQTIYMLQDPVLTSTNVMGNGAFSLIAHRVLQPIMRLSNKTQKIQCAA